MSIEDVRVIAKNWEGSSRVTALNRICAISSRKEPSKMTRIADILQKSGLTGKEEVMLLKGGIISFRTYII